MRRSDKLWDVLGEILAIVLVIVYILSMADAQWGFLTGTLLSVVSFLRAYGSLLLVAIVGMEAVSKRAFIWRLLFYIAVAAIVVFSFFPGTYENLI